jgi:hypothetical protein
MLNFCKVVKGWSFFGASILNLVHNYLEIIFQKKGT